MVQTYPNQPDNSRHTVAEASIILGVSPNTIRNRIKDGQIKAGYRRPTGHIFIEGSEINRFWRSKL